MLDIIILVIVYGLALYVTYEKRDDIVRLSLARKIAYALAFGLFPSVIIAWDLINWLVYDE